MRVCVVGGGASGLTAVKACLERNLDVTLYEKDKSVGGVWWYTDEIRDPDGARAYKRLVSNTTKELSSFSDFPFSDNTPQYFSHRHASEYLKQYSSHFRLEKYVHLETEVVSVRRAEDYKKTGQWMVTTKNAVTEEQKQEIYDAVIIATGLFRRSKVPDLPGLKEFPGKVIKAGYFKQGDEFTGQTVLVIGNSFSAGDISCETCHFADQLYLAVGDGTWVMPPNLAGNCPNEFVLNRHNTYCSSRSAGLEGFYHMCNSHIDHHHTGLAGKAQPGYCGVMISDEIGHLINSGKIKVKGHVESFDGNIVKFEDGSTCGPIQTVVLATGYTPQFPYLEDGILSEPDNISFYKHIFQANLSQQTIAFVGFIKLFCPFWPVYELQARWVAGVFSGVYKLPPQDSMIKYAAVVKQKLDLHPDYAIIYRDELADFVGSKPNLWRLIWTDPRLAWNLWFGPFFSAQYRLFGPNTWSGARERVLSGYTRTVTASKCRDIDGFRPKASWSPVCKALSWIVGIAVISYILKKNLKPIY